MPRTNKNKSKGTNKLLRTPSLPESSSRHTPPTNEQLATPSPTPVKERLGQPSRPSEVKTSTQKDVKWDSDEEMEEEDEEVSFERLAKAFTFSQETVASLQKDKKELEEMVERQMENFKLLLPDGKGREKRSRKRGCS